MELPKNPFKAAERFIQLREKCIVTTWSAYLQRFNDMILMPLIALFVGFATGDLFMLVSSGMTAFRLWKESIEFTELQFTMQRMRLRVAQVGGPFITTNNPKYMPYVWADALQRQT
jgi:hypothetical protein